MTLPNGIQMVWLGPVVDDATVLSSRAVSAAANHWQRGLLSGLRQLGTSVDVIGHLPEPIWPHGRLRITTKDARLPTDVQGMLTGYWNILGLRNYSLIRGYQKLIRQIGVSSTGNFVITYNASPSNVEGAKYARKNFGYPWICIVADGEAPSDADGYVFLSWGYFSSYSTKQPKFHLDGGITHKCKPQASAKSRNKPRVVMYSGTMTHYGGAVNLVRAFAQVPEPDIELWISGKGDYSEIKKYAARDPRVKILGFLSEAELVMKSSQVDIFVNPRPSYLAANEKNFPSKILEYLSYGKPVISTWTAGLSPDYRNALVILDEDTDECLATTVQTVLNWDKVQLNHYAQQSEIFVKNHTWYVQAIRFRKWLEDLCKDWKQS